jgi:hypothetical protein
MQHAGRGLDNPAIYCLLSHLVQAHLNPVHNHNLTAISPAFIGIQKFKSPIFHPFVLGSFYKSTHYYYSKVNVEHCAIPYHLCFPPEKRKGSLEREGGGAHNRTSFALSITSATMSPNSLLCMLLLLSFIISFSDTRSLFIEMAILENVFLFFFFFFFDTTLCVGLIEL